MIEWIIEEEIVKIKNVIIRVIPYVQCWFSFLQYVESQSTVESNPIQLYNILESNTNLDNSFREK